MDVLTGEINIAYKLVSEKLMSVLCEQFRLKEHFTALRQLLLLCQGDFAQALLDSMRPLLGKNANELYRHSLMDALDTAVQSSVAQNLSNEVLKSLDVRMLDVISNIQS